jgi:predicted ATPase
MMAVAKFQQGWILAEQGRAEKGVAQMCRDLKSLRATGIKTTIPYYHAVFAEMIGDKVGQTEEGLTLLAAAMEFVDTTGGRYYEAELYRLQGVLLLRQTVPDASQAETCFHHALDVARRQQAKSWELRAATSLARLWQSQGKGQDAYDLLAPVYGWFTEGFDTADLQEAKTLLGKLSVT